MKIITVASLKGGVGKTTLSIYLAEALRQLGKKTLVIDLDPNNSTTDFYLSRASASSIDEKNILHALTRKAEYENVIHIAPNGQHVIPATLALHRVGVEQVGNPASLLQARTKLKKLDYDFVILDTPPSLTYELRVGLFAADLVLTPVSPSRWIVHGLTLLAEELQQVGETIGKVPQHLMVPYMITASDEIVIDKLQIKPKTKTKIPRKAELRTKTEKGLLLKPKTKTAELFEQLAKEVM
jgi:chromosome partitioning protein